jgi:hypothetical protein
MVNKVKGYEKALVLGLVITISQVLAALIDKGVTAKMAGSGPALSSAPAEVPRIYLPSVYNPVHDREPNNSQEEAIVVSDKIIPAIRFAINYPGDVDVIAFPGLRAGDVISATISPEGSILDLAFTIDVPPRISDGVIRSQDLFFVNNAGPGESESAIVTVNNEGTTHLRVESIQGDNGSNIGEYILQTEIVTTD